MRILDRYILVEFCRYLLISITVLTAVMFIADYLGGVWDAEVSAIVLLKYAAYQAPQLFCRMVPAAALMATLVTLSLLNRKSELIAIHSIGIGLGHISFLIFGCIFIACCFTLVVYDRIVPPLAKQRTIYYWKVIKGRQDFTMDIKTTKIWYRSKNLIYNLRLFDKGTNTIQGIGIYFFDQNFHLMQHIEAENARYENSEWNLKNGLITIFPEQKTFPLSKHFQEKKLILPETPQDFFEIERQVETLRLKDLYTFIKRNREAGLDTKVYEVDLHSRIAISFVPLVMGLLAIPYSVRPKRQGGLGRDLGVCVGWIFIYWLLFSISMSLGRSGAVTPWASVWVPCIFFLFVALFLITRSRTQ